MTKGNKKSSVKLMMVFLGMRFRAWFQFVVLNEFDVTGGDY